MLDGKKDKFLFEIDSEIYELKDVGFFRTIYIYAKANEIQFGKTLEVVFSRMNWEKMFQPDELFFKAPIEEAHGYKLPVMIGTKNAIFFRPDVDYHAMILNPLFLAKFDIYKADMSKWIKRIVSNKDLQHLQKKYIDFIIGKESSLHIESFFHQRTDYVFFCTADTEIFVCENV